MEVAAALRRLLCTQLVHARIFIVVIVDRWPHYAGFIVLSNLLNILTIARAWKVKLVLQCSSRSPLVSIRRISVFLLHTRPVGCLTPGVF